MTTFLCPSCKVRTEWAAGVEVPMMGGVGAHLRMCEECASCAWCDELFRRSHPAQDREHNTKSGRADSAAFVCVHCYALDVHNMTAVVQPDADGTVRFSLIDGGAQ